MWRCGGLMISVLTSRSRSPSSSTGQGHCVVFLGKTLHSHSASLDVIVQLDTSEFNARGGGNPAID